MTARIIDGKAVARKLRAEYGARVEQLASARRVRSGLAVILDVAAGVPNLIVPPMVRTGAVVIDVGINRLPDGRSMGDVDFPGVAAKASIISPVPGGVGPMTVTLLLFNTLRSAERRVGSVDPADGLLAGA